MLKQKKGYILLETLVVVGVLSIVLVGMYSSFINMYSIFKERRTFDNTEFLYKTKILREQLTMTADLGSSKIVTICNNNDASNKCENNSEYGGIFEEFGIQYAFFAVANITSGDVNGMTNIPVTVKRYIRDLDTDADSNDVILIVAYQTDEIGYEVASINYSKTAKKMSEFDKLFSGLDSGSIDVVTKPSPEGETCTNTVAFDGTSDNNLRYVGANPCNYVTFNGETAGWRIVGKMNNVDDGSGNLETRIKLVRATSLGSYSWDSSASTVNRGDGVNDWTQADLKNELNGDYLNTSLNANTNWYNGTSNQQTASFDYTKRINASSQNLIGDAKWHLGGIPRATFAETDTVYPAERGTQVWGSSSGQTCNDGACPRATSWTGKVAIPYPSDFAFAVGEDVRSTCLGMYISYYYNNNCVQSQWITNYGLLITPSEQSASIVMNINGGLGTSNPSKALPVYPSVYLKSWVKPVEGNGSLSNPYILGF